MRPTIRSVDRSEQIKIRATKAEKNVFKFIAEQKGMSQTEFFFYMLSQTTIGSSEKLITELEANPDLDLNTDRYKYMFDLVFDEHLPTFLDKERFQDKTYTHKLGADHPILNKKNLVPKKKKITLDIHLPVQNNNKFVRGKKRTIEDIEFWVFNKYDYYRIDSCTYYLTLEYEDDEELNELVEDMEMEIHRLADGHNCHVEDICISEKDNPDRRFY